MRQITIKPLSNPNEADKGIFFPSWDCFCCSDSGTVTPLNLIRVCPGYHISTHPLVLCTRKDCFSKSKAPRTAEHWLEANDCEELHYLCRQEWLDTVRYWKENREQALAQQAAVAAGIASIGGCL